MEEFAARLRSSARDQTFRSRPGNRPTFVRGSITVDWTPANPKANDTQKAESPPKSAKDAILEKGSEGKGMREKINDEKNSEEPKNLAK